MTLAPRRPLAILAALLCATTATALETSIRASSTNTVTYSRGTRIEGNKGHAIEPSSANEGRVVTGNKGHRIEPSSANEGRVVTGNQGRALDTNRGDVPLEQEWFDADLALPNDCVPVHVDGATYEQCGGTWYEPSFDGYDTTYTEIEPRN